MKPTWSLAEFSMKKEDDKCDKVGCKEKHVHKRMLGGRELGFCSTHLTDFERAVYGG